MKIIGIMTMHRIVNYGSFLQAYGLKKTISSLGYNTRFIDYKYEKTIIEIKKNYLKKIINNINIYMYFQKKKIQKTFKTEYKKYISKYLGVNDEHDYSHGIDTLVIGSDEVFNCLQNYPVGYSKNLFGVGYEDCNVITYAASFGHTDYKKLKEYNIDEEIAKYLNNINKLSVRDQNSYNTIKELTGINSLIHLDPVLISDYDEEIGKVKIEDNNYIIIYAYTGRLTKKEEKYIKRFAKKYNKKIISIGFYQRIADKNLIIDPFEVLAYFKNADYVITDTFHGTIFSIKMQTKFCTIIRESNNNKLSYLLQKLNHEKQQLKSIEDIEKKYNDSIDFTKSNNIIKEEREKTITYLKEYL